MGGEGKVTNTEKEMLRAMFAIVVAVLIFAAVSETAHAAPIAPLPVGGDGCGVASLLA
jgi:hypothetical protein